MFFSIPFLYFSLNHMKKRKNIGASHIVWKFYVCIWLYLEDIYSHIFLRILAQKMS